MSEWGQAERRWGKARASALRLLAAVREGRSISVWPNGPPGRHVIASLEQLRACGCAQCSLATQMHDMDPNGPGTDARGIPKPRRPQP